MAEIKTRCPHCHSRYEVEAEILGQKITCPRCRTVFTVEPYMPPVIPVTPVNAASASGKIRVVQPTASPTMEPSAGTTAKLDSSSATGVRQVAAPPPSPSRSLTVADLGMELLPVQAGSFRQGSSRGYLTEQPERQAQMTTPFWMGRYPVTQMQYWLLTRKCPSYFVGEHLPVDTVSWADAMDFCRRLTERERVAGRIPSTLYFRLPTEADWEYSCRSPAAGVPDFCDDDDPVTLAQFAWYEGNSGGMTHPVGTLAPNRWGLHDMLGNVAEWCMDWFSDYSDSSVSNPTGPESGNRKVRRGGGWSSISRRCRPSDRVGVSPECRSALIGFRLVAVNSGTPPYDLKYRLM